MYRGSFPTALYHPDGRNDLFKDKDAFLARPDAAEWRDHPDAAQATVYDVPIDVVPVETNPVDTPTIDAEETPVKRGPGRPRKVR